MDLLEGFSHLVGYSIDARPGIKDEYFVGLCVGVHDRLQVFLILFAPFTAHANHRLAAAGDGGLAFWVNPGQDLVEGRSIRSKETKGGTLQKEHRYFRTSGWKGCGEGGLMSLTPSASSHTAFYMLSA